MNKKKTNKIKVFALLIMASFLLTGCTTTLVDRKGEAVVNPKTETKLIDNIICKPNDKDLQNLYKENGKSMNELPECQEVSLFKWRGIWDTIFIYPVAAIFIAIGTITNSFLIAIIIFSLIARAISFSSSLASAKQNKKMKEIQPQINEINEKFKGRTDSAAMIEKNDALKKLYSDNDIKPMAGCLMTFGQLPLLVALIEVLYRVPILPEFLKLSTISGIKHGNMWYLLLAVVLIGLALVQSLIRQDGNKLTRTDIIMAGVIVFMVSSIAFSVPSGMVVYFITSYTVGILEKVIIRHKLSTTKKSDKIE